LVDNLGRRAGQLGSTAAALIRPMRLLRRIRAGWPAVRETLADPHAPPTSFNRVLGPTRRFALLGTDLDDIRRVARAYGATVNDVLMTVLAEGLRELLLARREPVDVALRAYVPVSLHRAGAGPAGGNVDGMMAVALPLGVTDPVARLRRIAAQTAERKKRSRPAGGTLLRNGMVQRAFLRVMARQRWANVYVANVPGPPAPLYLAGSRLLALFPVVPLTGNITVGVGAVSYAGQFNVTVVVDGDACPDVEVLTAGMREALRSLDVVHQAA
jgi:WS/DGAT/MGAT family acyltransferase